MRTTEALFARSYCFYVLLRVYVVRSGSHARLVVVAENRPAVVWRNPRLAKFLAHSTRFSSLRETRVLLLCIRRLLSSLVLLCCSCRRCAFHRPVGIDDDHFLPIVISEAKEKWLFFIIVFASDCQTSKNGGMSPDFCFLLPTRHFLVFIFVPRQR